MGPSTNLRVLVVGVWYAYLVKTFQNEIQGNDMFRNSVVLGFALALAIAPGVPELTAQEKDKKDRTATISGVLKSRTEVKNTKHLIIEILADGEEKPRRYGVVHLPKEKGPIAEVLGAVQKAGIGDRVQCDLVYQAYGYEGGFTVTTFQVLKKADGKKDDGKEKK